MDKPNTKMITAACARLDMDEQTALGCYIPAPNMEDAGLFAPPGRGGGRLLVSACGETLWASSSLAPAAHVGEFIEGRRS